MNLVVLSLLAWALGLALGSREYTLPWQHNFQLTDPHSVALTEMRLIMAKVHFLFDVESADPDLDWIQKTVFRLLWAPPRLMARLEVAQPK